MRIGFLVLVCLGSSALARLGDTQDQAEARYGLPKKLFAFERPLVEGARDLMFHYEGWRIRCALLRATDGREYVVRQEYRKLWNSDVMKKGGVIQVRDFERDAVLKSEASSSRWREKLMGDLSWNPFEAMTNHLVHASGLGGRIWLREDGAVARVFHDSVMLELPQVLKYEAELKAIEEQKARAAVPKF
jgi:hypothetical protein